MECVQPGAVCDATMTARDATKSSATIPAAAVAMRDHFDRKRQDEVTSTYANGAKKINATPAEGTLPPKILQAMPWAVSCRTFNPIQAAASQIQFS
jgi:hypothetical protein